MLNGVGNTPVKNMVWLCFTLSFKNVVDLSTSLPPPNPPHSDLKFFVSLVESSRNQFQLKRAEVHFLEEYW